MPPAAANDGGKNSHKSQSHSSVTKNSGDSSKTSKICHIIKRADFDGYGFNLHTEKSKPGQYIGKVDANSPAETAGLREGYRILEVNGIPINNETHKQVVQRIKAIAWEVKLLVSTDDNDNIQVDAANNNKKADEKQANKNGSSSSSNKNHMNMMTSNNGNDTRTSAAATTTTTTTALAETTTTTTTTMNSSANDHSKNAKHVLNTELAQNNNMSTPSPQLTPTPSPLPLPLPPPSTTTKLNDDQHGAATGASSTSALKLPSTAAEMRAILQSKKKYNPKNEEVNLQEKYEIIQKL